MSSSVILFVCTGNICRSPMSEATLRHFLGAGDGIPVVASVGTSVAGEVPATKHAVSVLAKRGIGLSEHRSRHLERDDLVSADLIIVMTRQHELAVGLLDPEARSRTFLLGELVRLAGQVGQRLSGCFGCSAVPEREGGQLAAIAAGKRYGNECRAVRIELFSSQ